MINRGEGLYLRVSSHPTVDKNVGLKGRKPKQEAEATSNRIGGRVVARRIICMCSFTWHGRVKAFQTRVWKDLELLPLFLSRKKERSLTWEMKINQIVRLKIVGNYYLFNEGST